LIGEWIELAALSVTLDLFVEPRAIERFEPGAEISSSSAAMPRYGFSMSSSLVMEKMIARGWLADKARPFHPPSFAISASETSKLA
jgi:hypothetical protein